MIPGSQLLRDPNFTDFIRLHCGSLEYEADAWLSVDNWSGQVIVSHLADNNLS